MNCSDINSAVTILDMSPGTYYIGDLCYVMHDVWDEVCALLDAAESDSVLRSDGKYTLKDGREFALFFTAYGDGAFHTSAGNILGVDAGILGCIKVADITDKSAELPLGMTVEFTKPFSCVSAGGDMRFGHIRVNTRDDFYEDDAE